MDKNTKDRVLVEDLFDDFYTQLDASDIFSISDIYVRLDLPQGDLSISDEDETCTVHKTIYHWCVEKPENIDEVEKTAINTIRATLLVMQNKATSIGLHSNSRSRSSIKLRAMLPLRSFSRSETNGWDSISLSWKVWTKNWTPSSPT